MRQMDRSPSVPIRQSRIVINARQTQLQLTNPTDQAVRNAQFDADGSVNVSRLRPRDAGFGAATGAQDMRSVQLQLRFQF
jgi:hypothetical protein